MATLLQRPSGDVSTQYMQTFGTGSYHYDRLNEETADDTNGLYGVISAAYGVDILSFPALGVTGTINSVRLYGRFLAGTSEYEIQAPDAKVGLYIASTAYYSSTWRPAESFTEYYKEWTVSPATSSAFTVTELNNASYIIALQAGYLDNGDKIEGLIDCKCSQFWRVVDYTSTVFIPQIIIVQ